MVAVQEAKGAGGRPIIFALSNPKTQAEITAHDAYTWSDGQVIYGSGTQFDPVTVGARKHEPGQVKNECEDTGVCAGEGAGGGHLGLID